jgi:hypothetical protein
MNRPKSHRRPKRRSAQSFNPRPRQGRMIGNPSREISNSRLVVFNDTACPFPDRYQCKLRSEIFGYTGSGAGTGDYTWFVYLNSPYLPWNTGSLTGLTPNGITYSTLHSLGFTQLCNAGTYISYRVLNSSISVDVMSQSVADSVTVSLGPVDSTSGISVANSLGDRYVKSYTFGSGRTPPSRDGLQHSISQAKFLGVRPSAIQDDLSGKYTGNYNSAPSTPLYWSIQVETGDNAILNSPLEVRIQLLFHVEFFNLTGMALSG